MLAVAWLPFALPMPPALAQAAAPAANLVDQLAGSETPAEIDLAALRQQAADRIQSRADPVALRRPPVAPQLLKLPRFDFNVTFDPDTSVIRPQSYAVIGRIADALSDPRLLPYAFLVINHTEATGARAANLTLSQRRADAIRTVLASSFKISARRLQALGLGEEQLESGRPGSQAGVRAQIVAIGKVPAAVASPTAAGSVPPAKKGPAAAAKKKRN